MYGTENGIRGEGGGVLEKKLFGGNEVLNEGFGRKGD